MNNYDYNCVEGEGIALQDRTSDIYADPTLATTVRDMLGEMRKETDRKLAEQSRKTKLGFWVLGFFSLVLPGALTYLLVYNPTKEPPNTTQLTAAFSCHTSRLVS